MTEEMKMKQDNLYWEFNQDTQLIDILWILEDENGRFYQKTKSINPYGFKGPFKRAEKPVDAFSEGARYPTGPDSTKRTSEA